MTKTEHERRARLESILAALGFTQDEAGQLRRISNTLQRWFELECGTDSGFIERDPDTDRPYLVREWGNKARRYPVADRETGARRRLDAIIKARNERRPPLSVVMLQDRAAPDTLAAYVQTDPRGAALYILRPGDVPQGQDPGAYYSRGICVY